MQCKNKKINVSGLMNNERGVCVRRFECIITNDERGKTLSINDGKIQFTIPFEPIEKYLK